MYKYVFETTRKMFQSLELSCHTKYFGGPTSHA